MSAEALAAQVSELEARFTLQQDMLDKLSDVIWRQQRELDALAARVAGLEARLATATHGGGGDDAPPDDAPPHY